MEVTIGKKRHTESRDNRRPRKRAKVSDEDAISLSDTEEERAFHAYRRVYRLRYTTSATHSDERDYVEAAELNSLGWLEDEKALREWLGFYVSDHPGPVSITVDALAWGNTSVTLPDRTHILRFPNVPSNFNLDDYGFVQTNRSKYSVRDPLQAFQELARYRRARIDTQLFLDIAESASPEEMPFTIRVQVNCSFLCPAIFQPIAVDLQEAQRRLVLLLFPPSSPPLPSYHGQADIPFLFSVLQPAPALPSAEANEALQPESLRPTLLPFQRRTVGWMLGQEGKVVTADGQIVVRGDIPLDEQPLPLFWEKAHVSEEETWYVNRLRGLVSATRPTGDEDELDGDALGGIVAEEPGLGKTLECISTIIMNPATADRSPANKHWDTEAKIDVKEIKTTLIVTPPSLAPQWADELAVHAPELKVLIYDGWQKVPVPISERDVEVERERRRAYKAFLKAMPAKPKGKGKGKKKDEPMEVDSDTDEDDDIMDWAAYVNTFDVCITTYNVLQLDLGVARPPPQRPRRQFVQYSTVHRSRSPLVMCEWYRVIMDEVQMVGGGKTEEMVSLIPRLSSFAVSGTPARHQVADLIHVLRFLRVRAVTDAPRAWLRLQLPGYVREFTQLFRRYAVRTMKQAVKEELTIPPQTRYLVPIEFGRVQRHMYDQTLEGALLDLGLDARGVAATENWEADVSKLRFWLRRLREWCTHPQIGQLLNNGAARKLNQPGVLKTMTEVLQSMRDQNWRTYMEERTEKIDHMTSWAQLVQRDKKNKKRNDEALDMLLAAEKDAAKIIEDAQEAAAAHAKEGERLKAEVLVKRQEYNNAADKGKGKQVATRASTPDAEADDDDIPRNASTFIQQRLRLGRIALHKVKFLQGDVYHVLGKSYEVQENEAYAAADELRRVLLKSTEEAARKAMTYLDYDPVVKKLKEADLYVKVPFLGKGGIRSHDLVDEANEMIDDILNKQSALLWGWRQKLIALLTEPLGANGQDGADGQEYNRSLETQGEAEAYLQAYAALLADRRETLTSERTLLAAHDEREVKVRKTKAARKAKTFATSFHALETEERLERLEENDVLPEHELLLKQLQDERKALLEQGNPERAIKSVMVDLTNAALRAQKQEVEKTLIQEAAAQLRALLADQTLLTRASDKLIERLNADLTHLRKAFNERIAYFRQLQEISDTVAEAEIEGPLLDTKINTARARQRYMDNLSKSHEDGTLDEDDKSCILCKCDFVRGYITQCAHVYCEDCMKTWVSRAEGKACPVCRVPINSDQLQRFSIDNKSDQPPQPPPQILANNEMMPRSRRAIEYNYIDRQLLEDIQSQDLIGSFGSKIETLVKHLLYLNITEPGAKSIVFSAWADSLLIIQHALSTNGITCLRIDQNTGRQNAAKKFRTDPEIRVLLLHGCFYASERENAGLNVTCASRVFLVESVVHHAFEVQVYCYYAEETVERNILDLAAKQGLSLYTRDNAAGTLNVTPFAAESDKEVDAPTKKVLKGDFVYKTDDMLAIFFPHMFEDIEYLLPPEDVAPSSSTRDTPAASSSSVTRSSGRVAQANAVAGPSRRR
ncbi:SNF2 family N-terminal domain-containing protein [Epithele typhae]|uniref:SNF2 family N-terminal domain-containing protein n=1 Tax=Epithele typhae TaxID=378194 RepID=UPI0020072370|nr:SNF2 family N-terminal domain-containing protein [Epithele typhae]KAH9916397.1 SNF2 family N-terminal domain-containing protein [Epithele typhae]